MAKQCFFVGCDNNSTNNPEKLFLTVPQKVDRRKLWFEAVGRTYIPGKSLYCCEDHFDVSIVNISKICMSVSTCITLLTNFL